MSKFKVGQKVIIDSGVLRGRIAIIAEVLPYEYNLKVEGLEFGTVTYLENELKSYL